MILILLLSLVFLFFDAARGGGRDPDPAHLVRVPVLRRGARRPAGVGVILILLLSRVFLFFGVARGDGFRRWIGGACWDFAVPDGPRC